MSEYQVRAEEPCWTESRLRFEDEEISVSDPKTVEVVESMMDSARYFLMDEEEELGEVGRCNLALQLLEALERGLISEEEAMQFIEGEASQEQYEQLQQEVDN